MVAFQSLEPGFGVDLPEGGTVASTGEHGLHAPQRLGLMDDAVSFGPLVVSVASDEVAKQDPRLLMDNLRWIPEENDSDDGSGWFLGAVVGAPAAAAGSQSERQVTRRGLIAGTAALVGLGAVGTAAAQDGEEKDPDLTIAEAEITQADAPYWIGVFDVVDRALPVDRDEMRIAVDGEKRETVDGYEIDRIGNGETMAAGTTGTVEVYLKDAVSFRKRAAHWSLGVLGSDEITAGYRLPQPASDLSTNETVPLTTNRAIVNAADETDGSGAVVEIGGTGIPHAEERSGKERGQYDVRDIDGTETLVYEAGGSGPEDDELRVRFRAGAISSTLDALDRSF